MSLPELHTPPGETLEIERKFLIEYPETSWLEQQPGSCCAEIIQTYLFFDGTGSRRVRSWTQGGKTTYFQTCKQTLTDRTRIEQETLLSEEEYCALLLEADPSRHPVEKIRWCIPFDAHVLEIDLYPFWHRQAVLEIELRSEEEEFSIPAELRVIREVTGDPRYLNSALAREIPSE